MNYYTYPVCPRCGFLAITDMHSCPTVFIPYEQSTGRYTDKAVKVNKSGVVTYEYGTIRNYGTRQEIQA
jgi:hypothetical protein